MAAPSRSGVDAQTAAAVVDSLMAALPGCRGAAVWDITAARLVAHRLGDARLGNEPAVDGGERMDLPALFATCAGFVRHPQALRVAHQAAVYSRGCLHLSQRAPAGNAAVFAVLDEGPGLAAALTLLERAAAALSR